MNIFNANMTAFITDSGSTSKPPTSQLEGISTPSAPAPVTPPRQSSSKPDNDRLFLPVWRRLSDNVSLVMQESPLTLLFADVKDCEEHPVAQKLDEFFLSRYPLCITDEDRARLLRRHFADVLSLKKEVGVPSRGTSVGRHGDEAAQGAGRVKSNSAPTERFFPFFHS